MATRELLEENEAVWSNAVWVQVPERCKLANARSCSTLQLGQRLCSVCPQQRCPKKLSTGYEPVLEPLPLGCPVRIRPPFKH